MEALQLQVAQGVCLHIRKAKDTETVSEYAAAFSPDAIH